MRKSIKKTAAGAVLIYLILSAGLWLFFDSYSSFYNRMTGKKTAPASVTLTSGGASVSIIGQGTDIDLSLLRPDSKLYCAAYILSPDEFRAAGCMISLCAGF